MLTDDSPPTQKLADVLLNGGLDDFVLTRRPARSWRQIALDLHDATDGKVSVSNVTVQAWYGNDDPREATTTD